MASLNYVLKYTIFFPLILDLTFAVNLSDINIINTKLGKLRGTTFLSRNGKIFNAYMSIPYAQPPINELRFKDPKEVEPWIGVWDGTKYPPRCPQAPGSNGYQGQEDCLYLNIYTPRKQLKEKLPVWVFIYGGRRISGHVAPYKHGPHYIMDNDVIFITMNYRIGPLGFLSTEDNSITGNFGLKDEIIALKWIKNYIDAFGGDSSNVTISGGSTGGVDVGLLLTSPAANGLFERAISQSGHPLNTVLPAGVARQRAWELAELLGCKNNVYSSENLLKCLQKVPVEKLIMNWTRYKVQNKSISFGPVVESPDVEYKIIPIRPELSLRKSYKIPWLLGINSDEGTVGTLSISNIFDSPNFYNIVKQLLPNHLGFSESVNKERIIQKIIDTYFNSNSSVTRFNNYSKLFSMAHFFIGAIDSALLYNGPKYFYVYAHKNSPSYERNYYLRGLTCNYDTGVIHGEELRSLHHYPMILPPIITGNDKIVSDKVISMWFNFVKYSDPNGLKSEKIWNPIESANIEYLLIDKLSVEMNIQPFWSDYKNLKDILF